MIRLVVAPHARWRTFFELEITIVARAVFSVGAEGAGAVIRALAGTSGLSRAIRARARFGIVPHVVAEPIGLIAIAGRRRVGTSSQTAGECG